MANKQFNGRFQFKHDIEANWGMAQGFIPLLDELIVYDPDDEHPHPRFKLGDGVTNVNLLPFVSNIEKGEGDKAVQQVLDAISWAPDADQEEIMQSSAEQSDGNLVVGALGQFSFMEGGKSQAKGKRAHAEGTSTVAVGNYSHSEGNKTGALGTNSHAEGLKSVAQGSVSHAEGSDTKSFGEASHTEGANTVTQGYASHAEGDSAQAIGNSSHAEGYEAIAHGVAAHAEGRSSEAYGDFSHAEGMYSHANGEASHAGGRGAYTNAYGAFAHGDEVLATADFQTVFGRFNEVDNDAAFIIGNGEDKENRNNLFTVKKDGKIYVNGEELSADNIFFAEYGVTTSDEIIAAYQAGKACMCKYEGYVYNLCGINEPFIFFTLLYSDIAYNINGPRVKYIEVYRDNWSATEVQLAIPSHIEALNIEGRAEEKSIEQVADYASWAPDGSQVELIADADVKKNENGEVLSGAFGAFSSAFGGTSQATAKRAHAEGTTTVAAGKYSHTEGNGTYTKGNSAHAEGILTAAIGDNAHSEGDHTRANGNSSHAEGGSTTADGTHSHAEGASTQAMGEQAHAEGAHSIAEGNNSHAEGELTHALGVNSHAEGQSTHAEGVNSHAEGSQTLASGYASHAGGEGSIAAHADSFVHGSGLVSGRDQQAVFGVFNEIDENALFAVGVGYSNDDRRTGFQVNMGGQVFVNGNELVNNNNIENGANTGAVSQKHNAESWTPDMGQDEINQSVANKTGNDIAVGAFGQYSFMEGGKSQAKGKRAHAEGTSTVAVGDYSHAEGNKTGSLGTNSHAEGLKSVAQGGVSHAEGGNTKAIGEASHTEGVDTIARSYASHAEGAITETKKDYSHAEGYTSIADGIASHAEGYGTLTGNDAAHAEGLGTRAMGAYAHAEGAHTEATGDNSHAEGVATKATAYAAHAGGDSTEANHSGSFAHGAVLKTGRDQQAVFGKFNEVDADALFVVGNGESADAPSNAFVVKQDGKIWINGTSLNIEGGEGENALQQTPETESWTSTNPYVQTWIDRHVGTADDNHKIQSEGYVVKVGTFGKSSSATGGKSQALGKKSHVEGSKNIAFESNAHAEGNETFAGGKHSHSEGNTTAATGAASHAEGISTYASANAAHVEGQGTVATFSYAHAEGLSSKAMGEAAHAEGVGNTASAQGAHAEGAGNTASGRASHAEGDTNKATGDVSHAGGALSEANHSGAFVHGAGVRSGAPYQTAIGEWNAISDDAMFVIGGGTAEADRKNIFEVKKNGEAFLGSKKIATLADISNAGGDCDVFVATYGTTTYAEIDAAVKAGKAVLVKDVTYKATGDMWFYGVTLTLSHDHPAGDTFPCYSFAGLGTPVDPYNYAQSTYMISTMVNASGWKTPTALNLSDAGGNSYINYSDLTSKKVTDSIAAGQNVIVVDGNDYYTLSNLTSVPSLLGNTSTAPDYVFSCIHTNTDGSIVLKRIYVDSNSGADRAEDIELGASGSVSKDYVDTAIAELKPIQYLDFSTVTYQNISDAIYASKTVVLYKTVNGSYKDYYWLDQYAIGLDDNPPPEYVFSCVKTGDDQQVVLKRILIDMYNGAQELDDIVLSSNEPIDVSGKMDKFGEVVTEDGSTTIALNGETMFYNTGAGVAIRTLNEEGAELGLVHVSNDGATVVAGTALYIGSYDMEDTITMNGGGISIHSNNETSVTANNSLWLAASESVGVRSGTVDIGAIDGVTTIYGGSLFNRTSEVHVYDDGIVDVHANGSFEVYTGTEEDGMSTITVNASEVNIESAQVNIRGVADPVEDSDAVNKSYVDTKIGDIESVLDSIIAIQNSLIGGNA